MKRIYLLFLIFLPLVWRVASQESTSEPSYSIAEFQEMEKKLRALSSEISKIRRKIQSRSLTADDIEDFEFLLRITADAWLPKSSSGMTDDGPFPSFMDLKEDKGYNRQLETMISERRVDRKPKALTASADVFEFTSATTVALGEPSLPGRVLRPSQARPSDDRRGDLLGGHASGRWGPWGVSVAHRGGISSLQGFVPVERFDGGTFDIVDKVTFDEQYFDLVGFYYPNLFQKSREKWDKTDFEPYLTFGAGLSVIDVGNQILQYRPLDEMNVGGTGAFVRQFSGVPQQSRLLTGSVGGGLDLKRFLWGAESAPKGVILGARTEGRFIGGVEKSDLKFQAGSMGQNQNIYGWDGDATGYLVIPRRIFDRIDLALFFEGGYKKTSYLHDVSAQQTTVTKDSFEGAYARAGLSWTF